MLAFEEGASRQALMAYLGAVNCRTMTGLDLPGGGGPHSIPKLLSSPRRRQIAWSAILRACTSRAVLSGPPKPSAIEAALEKRLRQAVPLCACPCRLSGAVRIYDNGQDRLLAGRRACRHLSKLTRVRVMGPCGGCSTMYLWSLDR